MTGPMVLDTPGAAPPHVLSPDEFDKAQPAGANRVLSPDEFDKAQTLTSSALKVWRLPSAPPIPAAPKDAVSSINPRPTGTTYSDQVHAVLNDPRIQTAVDQSVVPGIGSMSTIKDAAAVLDKWGAALEEHTSPDSWAGTAVRTVASPILRHPWMTAGVVGAQAIPVVGPVVDAALMGDMASNVALYGYQTHLENAATPEARKIMEADPERISGKAATIQAVMLGIAPLAHLGLKGAGALDVSDGMVDATDLQAHGGQPGITTDGPRPPAVSVQTPQGAEVLGSVAGRHGLPADASPYPPATPLDAAWKSGHESATSTEPAAPVAAETAPASDAAPSGEPAPTADPVAAPSASAQGPDAPVAFTTAKGSRYVVNEDGTTTRNKAARPEHPGDAGPQEPSQRTYYVDKAGLDALAEFQAQGVGSRRLAELADGRIGVKYDTGPSAGKFEKRTVVTPHTAPAVGLTPVEIWKDGKVVHFGNEITAVETPPVTDVADASTSVAPAEGTGDLKTRGLARGIEEKAIAQRLTTGFGDLPQYRTMSIAEHAARAADLLKTDPELARQIAMGETHAPDGMTPEAVLIAVENKATAEGDVATLRALATESKLTAQATEMGQRIRTLAERDPESPVGAIQTVMETRQKAVRDVPKATAAIVKQVKAQLKGSKQTVKDWSTFVDSLRC